MDDVATDFNTKWTELELGDFFVGGVTMDINQEQVWSINLKNGFVGCMRGLVVGEQMVDLGGVALVQDLGSVRGGEFLWLLWKFILNCHGIYFI